MSINFRAAYRIKRTPGPPFTGGKNRTFSRPYKKWGAVQSPFDGINKRIIVRVHARQLKTIGYFVNREIHIRDFGICRRRRPQTLIFHCSSIYHCWEWNDWMSPSPSASPFPSRFYQVNPLCPLSFYSSLFFFFLNLNPKKIFFFQTCENRKQKTKKGKTKLWIWNWSLDELKPSNLTVWFGNELQNGVSVFSVACRIH